MIRAVYDVETYPNFFSCYVVDYDTEEELVFEISSRKNDLQRIIEFLKNINILIGFNSLHYDNIMLNFLYKEYNNLKDMDASYINKKLKKLNDDIIVHENYQAYSKYRYNQPFKSIDLFMYWSKLTRRSKKLSLKSLAVNISWPRIQELPLHPDTYIQESQMAAIISYNGNDTKVTKCLAKDKMSKDINLRREAQKKYGFDCMSWDGVKLGLNILVKRYCDRTSQNWDKVNELRTHRSEVDIGALILPIISFDEADDSFIQFIDKKKKLITQFNTFYGLLKYLKSLKVSTTKEVNCRVMFQGNRYDVKSGGLHTFHNPSVVTPQKGQKYKDKDV